MNVDLDTNLEEVLPSNISPFFSHYPNIFGFVQNSSLVGGWTTHLEKMLVKLSFPKHWGESSKIIWVATNLVFVSQPYCWNPPIGYLNPTIGYINHPPSYGINHHPVILQVDTPKAQHPISPTFFYQQYHNLNSQAFTNVTKPKKNHQASPPPKKKKQVTRGKKLMSRQSWANNVISEAHGASTCTRPSTEVFSGHRFTGNPKVPAFGWHFLRTCFLVSEGYLQFFLEGIG